jgi:cAMP-binding proteins - catabolite gene activator and regulatory subunit of cAMP-dependent protein kinases
MSEREELRRLVAAALGDSDQDADSEALETMLRCGRSASTREGRAFFYQGDRPEAALLVLRGRARLLQYKGGARKIELPSREKGDWLGLAALAADEPQPYDALAETECLCLALPRYGFALASRERCFEALVARALAAEILALHSFIADESPTEKIAAYLLARRARIAGADKPRVAVTQGELAQAIGVTRETVNKKLGDLEARGLVRALRGQIEVVDWDALAELRDE